MKSWVAGFAVVAVLSLAACAPGSPSGTPKPTPTPTPTPTTSAAIASAPSPASPLSCAELFTIGGVQAALHDAITVKVDETHPAPQTYDTAVLQAGGTECAWGGQSMTDAEYDTGVTIDVLPDAVAAFAQRGRSTRGGPVADALGAGSTYQCESRGGPAGYTCEGDALAADYWVSFTVGDLSAAAGAGPATVLAILKPILAAIASAGGSVAAWAPRSAPFDGAALCTGSAAADLVGSAAGQTLSYSPGYDGGSLPDAAAAREHMVECNWSAGGSQVLTIATLPGGSWLWPRYSTAPPLWTLVGHGTAFDVPNTDGALHSCGEACVTAVNVHGSLVFLSLYLTEPDGGTAASDRIAVKLIAGIASS